MDSTSVVSIGLLKRDFALRGYSDDEIDELVKIPILLIPGRITAEDSDVPSQVLTPEIAFLSKDLQEKSITNRVVLRRDIPRTYTAERQAHIDLGTIVVSIFAAQQLGQFANIAQILDFLLNLLRLRFSSGRTQTLMPNLKFDLEVHDGERMAKIQVDGPADQVTKTLTPARITAMLGNLNKEPGND